MMKPNERTSQMKAEVDPREGGRARPSGEPATLDGLRARGTGHPGAQVSLSRAGPWAVPLLLVLLFIFFSIAAPHTFWSLVNARAMISGQATVLLLSMAVIVPLRAGVFDLSVSAVMIMTGATFGVLTAHHWPVVAAGILAVLIGPVTGVINGLLVLGIGIDSFIATLGTMTILTGLATLVTGGNVVITFPAGLTNFDSYHVLGFPTPVWAGWVVALILWYVFELTPCGRYLLFIGGNPGAAQLAGLRVRAFRQGAFLVSATLSAVTGLLYAGALGSVDPSAGASYLLPPITAAFLGASAIKLGRFNVVGALVAIYLLAVGITGLQLLGLQGWIIDVFNGACLVVAVGFAALIRRPASR
jgi:ribose transport system permease protein